MHEFLLRYCGGAGGADEGCDGVDSSRQRGKDLLASADLFLIKT